MWKSGDAIVVGWIEWFVSSSLSSSSSRCLSSQIGEGQFAVVEKARVKSTGMFIAVKKLKPQYLNTVVRCVQSKEKKRERQSKCGLCGAEFSILSLSLFSVEMKHTHIHPELGRESRYNMI